MSFDPMDFCYQEDRPEIVVPAFAFAPSKIYPATIARIREVLASGEMPIELVDDPAFVTPGVDPTAAAVSLVNRAKLIPAKGWDDALIPRGEFIEQQAIAVRAEALETARLWFTQAMQVRHRAVLIHILKDDDYKL